MAAAHPPKEDPSQSLSPCRYGPLRCSRPTRILLMMSHSRRSKSPLGIWELSPLSSGLPAPRRLGSPRRLLLSLTCPLPLDPSTLGYRVLGPWYAAVPSGYPVYIGGLTRPTLTKPNTLMGLADLNQRAQALWLLRLKPHFLITTLLLNHVGTFSTNCGHNIIY